MIKKNDNVEIIKNNQDNDIPVNIEKVESTNSIKKIIFSGNPIETNSAQPKSDDSLSKFSVDEIRAQAPVQQSSAYFPSELSVGTIRAQVRAQALVQQSSAKL